VREREKNQTKQKEVSANEHQNEGIYDEVQGVTKNTREQLHLERRINSTS